MGSLNIRYCSCINHLAVMCSADITCLCSLVGLLFCWCDSFLIVEMSAVSAVPSGGKCSGSKCDYSLFRELCPYFFCIYLPYVHGFIPFCSRAFRIWALRLHWSLVVLGILSVASHSDGGCFFTNFEGTGYISHYILTGHI